MRRIACSRARPRRAASRRASASRLRPARRCLPGADAVVMVEETERASGGTAIRVLTPVYPRQNVGRRGADIATGRRVVRARAGAQSEPHRRAGGDRRDRRRGVREAVGRDSLDRQRDRRARPAAAARADLRHQPLHARGDHRPARRHLACRCRSPPIRSRSSRARSTAARGHDVVVFSGGSSVGERDLILDVLRSARRGALSRHRGEAGQADGLRTHRPARRCSACPAIRRRASRTRTCCSCRSCAQVARLPRWRSADGRRCRSRAASSRRPAAISSIRCELVDGRAEPAFKASGDITSMANADGYIEIPAQTDVVEAGTVVTVKLF